MKKLAVATSLLTIIMSVSAFAGGHYSGEAKATFFSKNDITAAVIEKLEIDSLGKALTSCEKRQAIEDCMNLQSSTTCSDIQEKAIYTLTDIVSEDSTPPVSYSVSCRTTIKN